MLCAGLQEWGGPARCTEELARAMGFDSVANLFAEGDRMSNAIESAAPLSRTDWTRALLATEVVFASRVVGAGLDWEVVTGLSDVRTLQVLRDLQRRIATGGVIGTVFGTRPARHPAVSPPHHES